MRTSPLLPQTSPSIILQRVRTRRRPETELGGFSGHAGEDQAHCCRIQLLGCTAKGLDKEEDGCTLRDEMMQCATAGGGGPGGGALGKAAQ